MCPKGDAVVDSGLCRERNSSTPTPDDPPQVSTTRFNAYVFLLMVTFLLFTSSAATLHANQAVLLSQTRISETAIERQKQPTGLTYDPCTTRADCVSPRGCINLSSDTAVCDEQTCICFPPAPRFCTSNDECPPGEVCAKANGTAPHCASAAFAAAEPGVHEFFRANGTGLTLDSCGVTDACRPPRQCTSRGIVCKGDRNCVCTLPNLQFCSSSNQCIAGERCSIQINRPVCISSEVEAVEWNSSRGLTGDFCRLTDECAGDRKCLTDQGLECKENNSCSCTPDRFTLCIQSSVCDDGERCSVFGDNEQGACFSEQAAPYFNRGELQPRLGLLGEVCYATEDCKPPRECVPQSLFGTCKPGLNCGCQAPGAGGCEAKSDCEEGEICVWSGRRLICLKESAALDEGYTPVGNITGPFEARPMISLPAIQRICIAAHLLRGFSRGDLVFEKDMLARVLCDAASNCATPGHIVLFKSKAMMMKSYCSLVGCVKRVMEVNSPKYKKRLRIKGLTNEVEFSALAAQYGTRAEEMLITFMMRAGL